MQVEAVTPVIGAEISGVDLSSPLDAGTVDAIYEVLMDHLVIFDSPSLSVSSTRRIPSIRASTGSPASRC